MIEAAKKFCSEDGLFHNQYFLVFFLLIFFVHLFIYAVLSISVIDDVKKGVVGPLYLPSYIPILVLYLLIWFHLYQIRFISTELLISVVMLLSILMAIFFLVESYKVLSKSSLRTINTYLVYITDVYIVHLFVLLVLKTMLPLIL
jgi:hypothetical protein